MSYTVMYNRLWTLKSKGIARVEDQQLGWGAVLNLFLLQLFSYSKSSLTKLIFHIPGKRYMSMYVHSSIREKLFGLCLAQF